MPDSELELNDMVIEARDTHPPTFDIVHLLNTNPKKLIKLLIKFVEYNMTRRGGGGSSGKGGAPGRRVRMMAPDDTLNDVANELFEDHESTLYRFVLRIASPRVLLTDVQNDLDTVHLSISNPDAVDTEDNFVEETFRTDSNNFDFPVLRTTYMAHEPNENADAAEIDNTDEIENKSSKASSSDPIDSTSNNEPRPRENVPAEQTASNSTPPSPIGYKFEKAIAYDVFSSEEEIVGDECLFTHRNDSADATTTPHLNSKFSYFLMRDGQSAVRGEANTDTGGFNIVLSTYACIDLDALYAKNLNEKGITDTSDRQFLLLNEHLYQEDPAKPPVRRVIPDAAMNSYLKLYTIYNVRCMHRNEVI